MNDHHDEIDYSDFRFDFDDYFRRFNEKQLSETEKEAFTARIIGMFCRDLVAGNEPPRWVQSYLVEQFSKVLMGEEWESAFPLPWTTATPLRTRAESRSLDIFCDIANQLKESPDAKITNVIANAANSHNSSYETARAAYYKHVKNLPKDFLKRDSEK